MRLIFPFLEVNTQRDFPGKLGVARPGGGQRQKCPLETKITP